MTDSKEPPERHPAWCWPGSCTRAAGGLHQSSAQLVRAEAGKLLIVDIVQAGTGGPVVRLAREGEHGIVQLSMNSARQLGRCLINYAIAGRMAGG